MGSNCIFTIHCRIERTCIIFRTSLSIIDGSKTTRHWFKIIFGIYIVISSSIIPYSKIFIYKSYYRSYWFVMYFKGMGTTHNQACKHIAVLWSISIHLVLVSKQRRSRRYHQIKGVVRRATVAKVS